MININTSTKHGLSIFFLILIISCKSSTNYLEKKDCFYKSNEFVYLNFFNSTSNERLIPNITGIIDKNFYLLNNNYRLANDTLHIKLLDKRNVRIADSDSVKYIIGSINYIKLKRGSKTQQAFKIDKIFKVLSLEFNEKKLNLNLCE